MRDNFSRRNKEFEKKMSNDTKLLTLTKKWFYHASKYEYSYHFNWLGRPIIQFPQDLIALQEVIWETQPDVVIETGIARGGSLIFYASMLKLIGKNGFVVGIDIDIRDHNRRAILKHPLNSCIKMIQGSSTDEKVFKKVENFIKNKSKIMVILDSNHTHQHVLEELRLYSPLVTKGCYLVVMDTVIEEMPRSFVINRPWNKWINPASAVREFLKSNHRFVLDSQIPNKLLITVARSGYLRCIKNT